MMEKKKWEYPDIVDEVPVDSLSREFGLDPSLISIIINRGYRDHESIQRFLHPHLSDTYSPFYFSSMYQAVARIRDAIDKKEKIGIFSDSDLDGLTALAILQKLFNKLDIPIYYRFPRMSETYGLTKEIVDEFHSQGIVLLITVDAGIRDHDEIEYALSRGIETIITDHHEPDQTVPSAIVINPKLASCGYPFKFLSGAGVAMKLAGGLLMSYTSTFRRHLVILAMGGQELSMAVLRDGVLVDFDNIESMTGKTLEDCISRYEDPMVFIDMPVSAIPGEYEFLLRAIEIDSLVLNGQSPAYVHEIIPHLAKQNNATIAPNEYAMQLAGKVLSAHYRGMNKINGFMNEAVELGAIGTVADVVPLVGENRIIVAEGIKQLQNTGHSGLQRIMNGKTHVSAKSISWDIAPFLNTPGRYGKTDLAADMLLNAAPGNTDDLFNSIHAMNLDRKKSISALVDTINDEIAMDKHDNTRGILYVHIPESHEGIIGIIANKMVDMYHKPVILTVPLADNPGFCKGSGRAPEDYNLLEHALRFESSFARIGGHPQAFGFTIEEKALTDVIEKLVASAGDTGAVRGTVNIDCQIPIHKVNLAYIDQLEMLGPFGKGNEEPLFLSPGVIVSSFRRMGKSLEHGKFSSMQNKSIDIVGWRIGDRMEELFSSRKPLDLLYTLEKNTFNGFSRPQLSLVDIDVSRS